MDVEVRRRGTGERTECEQQSGSGGLADRWTTCMLTLVYLCNTGFNLLHLFAHHLFTFRQGSSLV